MVALAGSLRVPDPDVALAAGVRVVEATEQHLMSNFTSAWMIRGHVGIAKFVPVEGFLAVTAGARRSLTRGMPDSVATGGGRLGAYGTQTIRGRSTTPPSDQPSGQEPDSGCDPRPSRSVGGGGGGVGPPPVVPAV